MKMKSACVLLMLCLLAVAPPTSAAPALTATGIPLDAPWKVTIYALARAKFHHPAWGWQHSERNYRVAVALAQADGLRVDADVLFAAAFLHDMAAFEPCPGPHQEHGDCAAQASPAILGDAGFPMAKLAAVQAAERGHMYYSDPGTSPEAVVLHDADSLDFLGVIGAARMISLAGDKAADFAAAVQQLRAFERDIPPRLRTNAGKALGAQRATELGAFLDALAAESFDGRAM